MGTDHKVKTRLGDLLLDKKLITEEQLQLSIQIQKTNQFPLGEILVKNGWVTKRQINRALRVQSKLRNAILTSILSFSPLVLIGAAADAFAAPKTVKESQLSPGKAFGKGKKVTDASDPADSTDTSEPSSTVDSSTTPDSTDTSEPSSTADSSTTSDSSTASDTSTAPDSTDTSEPSSTADSSTTSDSSTANDDSTNVVAADHGATIHLSWDYPLERVDGSGLEVFEIDRFHVYQLDDSGGLGAMHVVDGLITELNIEGLQDGEYHFAVTVIDNDGLESDYSEVVSISVL